MCCDPIPEDTVGVCPNCGDDVDAEAAALREALREIAFKRCESTEHRLGCDLYQRSYAIRFPGCSCGLDALKETSDGL